jgi:hypothetical protein
LRDQSAPADTETIGVDSKALEQGNIDVGHVVRVASVVSAATVGDLTRNSTHVVPDRGTAALLVVGTFDLV